MFARAAAKDESYHKSLFHIIFYQNISFFANPMVQIQISSIFC